MTEPSSEPKGDDLSTETEIQPADPTVTNSTADDTTTTEKDSKVPSPDAVLAESKELLDDDIQNAILASLDQESSAPPTGNNNSGGISSPTRSAKKSSTPSNRATATATAAETVSVERKEQLLLEARVNRLQWIHQVPLPYRKAESPDDPWIKNDELANFVNTCHAAALMPSTTKILSHLYGMEDQRVTPEDVAARLGTLVRSLGASCMEMEFACPCLSIYYSSVLTSFSILLLSSAELFGWR